jgi:glycosyltransferase involved in cell wall biosynthesis
MVSNQEQQITFIIPAYNCQQTLSETVHSIYENNFMEGDEVIVVNDASTDNTFKIAKELQRKYPAIQILQHKINKGTAAASRNTGIENASNELIFCLDSDNILIPGSVLQLKRYLLEEKADAAAFGEIHFFKDNTDGTRRPIYNTIFKSGVFTLADALCSNYFIGQSGNYLFTKQSWLKAGRYFEPTLINQTLDSWTFTIRQLGIGAKLVKLANTYYLHRNMSDSHWNREIKRGNVSLAALTGIMPFLDKINEADVEYMFGEGRYTWFNDLEKRPIRLKIGAKGTKSVHIVKEKTITKQAPLLQRIVGAIIREVKLGS